MIIIIKRFYLVSLAIIFSALGQSLSILTDSGSLIWPASIVNILHYTGWPMAVAITFEGSIIIVLSTLVEWEHPFRHIIPDFLYLLPYAILMQTFAGIWKFLAIPKQPFIIRLIIDIFSFFIIFLGASVNADVSFFCCHPNDTLTKCCKKCIGPTKTMYLNLLFPLLIILVFGILNHHVYAFHIGTIIAYLIRPRILSFYNSHFNFFKI